MSYSYAGILIKRMDFTVSWGVNPGQGTIVGYGSPVAPETPGNLSFGGATFQGIVENCIEGYDSNGGREIRVTFVDNRIFLRDEVVLGYWNGEEVLPDDPSTPGIDQHRRYRHMLPQNWASQTWTFTDEPMTAQQILESIAAGGAFQRPWSFLFTEEFDRPAFNIDCLNGKKLNNVLSEIIEQIGVAVRLVSGFQLGFAVKGFGAVPAPPPTASHERSSGLALGGYTSVRIIGDRNTYQREVTLEADWIAGYQSFFHEAAWFREVQTVFSIDNNAEAAARAREVTVREYAAAKGAQWADRKLWHDISRMDIPVWTYLREIVFKAYRIPPATLINNVPLPDVGIRDELICGMTYVASSGVLAPQTDVLYPGTQAFFIGQGLGNIDLADPHFEDALTPNAVDRLRTLWSECGEFTVDRRSKTVYFRSIVCSVGTGATALFIRANEVPTSEPNAAELNNIVVPNANAVIGPASVKGVFAFELERFQFLTGSGARRELSYISGLCKHVVGTQEIRYKSGRSADEVALQAASRALTTLRHVQSGGFTRLGTAGMALNGAIDRIIVSLGDHGLSERVDYSKERDDASFVATRELERRSRTEELFPGQKALAEAARQIRRLGMLRASNGGSSRAGSVLDVVSKPLGNDAGQLVYVRNDSATSYPIGMPVFAKPTVNSGIGELTVDGSGRFVGCITVANLPAQQGYPMPTVGNGVVNCRVKGPFTKDQAVGVNSGQRYAQAGGSRAIGIVLQTYTGSEEVIAKVRIGAGGGSDIHPWQPDFVGAFTVKFRKGFVLAFGRRSISPSNMNATFTVPPNSSTGYYVWAVANVSADPDLTSLTLASGSTLPVAPQGNPVTGAPPAVSYCPIFYATSSSTGVDFFMPLARSVITLDAELVNANCASNERALRWRGLDGSVLA